MSVLVAMGRILVMWVGCCCRLLDVSLQGGKGRECGVVWGGGSACPRRLEPGSARASQAKPSQPSLHPPGRGLPAFGSAPMPGPTQALSPNGENNNDIIQDNGTIIPFRKHTVRGERSYR